MTQDEKRIKLAEAAGWKHIQRLLSGWHGLQEQGPLEELPDYFNDLNAMHELVMSQPKEVRSRFRLELEWLIAPSTKPGKVSGIQLMNAENYDQWFHATATQRAEAIGLTLNLWK